MAAVRPTYMLAPNWDIPPDGALPLGIIIADPRDPLLALNRPTRIPVPQVEVTSMKHPGWKRTYSELLSGRIGIWSNFLASVLGIGADVAWKGHRDTDKVYKCDELETIYWQPSNEYITQSLQIPAVEEYLADSWLNSIYIVTGLKIAWGGSIETSTGIAHGCRAR